MDYYRILGVDHSATAEEIKRAYRRLAVTYHPDKNPAPGAENIFKQVNEAYDVLGDPVKRHGYDHRLQNTFIELAQEMEGPRHRDPAYRPRKKKAYRKSEREDVRELMARYLPLAQKAIYFCFSIAVFLLIDFVWPDQISTEQIEQAMIRRTYSRNSSTVWWVVETDGGYEIDMPYEVKEYFQPGQSVIIHSSFFLDMPISASVPEQEVRIRKSIYGNFIFAPATLLIVSSLGIVFRKNSEYGFNFGVVSFVILLFTGVLILVL